MTPALQELKPLLDAMAERGYLDVWLVRHRISDSQVEGAVDRLVSKVAAKIGYSARRVIECEADSVDSVVASTLIETVHEVVSSDVEQALVDEINGRHNIVPRAVANDVLDAGRKLRVRKLPLVAEEDGYEVQAVELEVHRPEPETPIPAEWLAAIALMQQRGDRMTFKNLARTLGVSDRHLRRIRAAQK